MHTSRLGLSATKSMCLGLGLGLGLGVSALDRISKRPNLKNKRSNRSSKDRIERSTNNAINNNTARRRGRLF